ncbi:unnamed protein product [Microthlaspi erraticum]|uniref:F-box domain-containing protein n=1 Tax=Microthlaspi erraticum TaxID=1685480 RepID=A0A6D2IDY2_9BRAS|nr:unnamed protein product [Microthlaspi erraticum]
MELPPEVVIEIISYLRFKQAARLSVVAKRWKNLYREMKNVVFRDSEFEENGGTASERALFVQRMRQWISTFPGSFINRFEIYFAEPYEFQESIIPLIEFAVSKQVKILALDFSDPDDHDPFNRDAVITLPSRFYGQTETIESLKLISCSIDCTKLKNSTVLRRLTIGRAVLADLTTTLSNFPSLESLRFISCMSWGKIMITQNQRLTELVFEDCDFYAADCTLELPRVMIFECSGNLPSFTFRGVVNEKMQEAELNFWFEEGRGHGTGGDLGKILNGVSPAKTLKVDSFLLQMIPYDGEELLPSFGTRHLVMQTNLHPDEFIGIRLMLDKCPVLESLTFDIVTERTTIMEDTVLVPADFNADTYWLDEITHECLEKTLKVVVVKDFGNMYELQILTYLIKHGLVLERLDLYMNDVQMPRVEMALQNVPRGSSRLQITLHNASTEPS